MYIHIPGTLLSLHLSIEYCSNIKSPSKEEIICCKMWKFHPEKVSCYGATQNGQGVSSRKARQEFDTDNVFVVYFFYNKNNEAF
jgi:hypothetical protein